MKLFAIFLIAALPLITPDLRSQDAAAAAAAKAERDVTEERYKRLDSALETLLAAKVEQDKRIAALADEIESLRRQTSKPSGNYANQDELRRLAVKLQEIEDNRIADNKKVTAELEKLIKVASVSQSSGANKKSPKAAGATDNQGSGSSTTGGPPEKGFEHIVAPGDTISTIALAFKEKGIKVTVDQILKANPKLEPTKLKVGQKLWIPAPEKQ